MTTPHLHLTHPKYRPDIDGLRAVAVLSVVAFHAFPNWLKGGFIGVDIFFVISGFLISTIIFENLDRGTFSFAEFYARRIKRIFPALLLVLIASFSFGWFVLLADEYKQLGKHIAAGAGFVSNFVLWNESGYFDNAAYTKPLLHLWSLGIEEQFYIVWPLFLWLSHKRRFNLLFLSIITAFASFYLNIKHVETDSVADFYSPQTRFWELMSGSILAWITLYKPSFSADTAIGLDRWLSKIIFSDPRDNDGTTLVNAISTLGIMLLFYGFWRIDKDLGFPGKWATIPVLGTVMVILAGSQSWVNRNILSHRILVWFGLISFPLYLWHWPLLSLSRVVAGQDPSQGLRIAVVSLSIVLAWLTYKLIERPIRFGKCGKLKVTILTLLMVTVGFTGYSTYERNGLQFRTIAKQAQDFDYTPGFVGYTTCNTPDLKVAGITLDYCLTSKTQAANAAIIGDSHAEDKFHGLVALDRENNWMLIGNPSCPPVSDVSVEGDQKGCQVKFKVIIDYIIKNKKINNVVLSYFGNYFKTTAYAADHIRDKVGPQDVKISSSIFSGDRQELFYDGLNSTIKRLIGNGKTVTLFIDVPELPFMPKDCFRDKLKKCEVPRKEVMTRQAEMRNMISRLKTENPGLKIFDPIDLICGEDECSYKRDDIIIYKDSHHLTPRGSNLFAKRYIESRSLPSTISAR